MMFISIIHIKLSVSEIDDNSQFRENQELSIIVIPKEEDGLSISRMEQVFARHTCEDKINGILSLLLSPKKFKLFQQDSNPRHLRYGTVLSRLSHEATHLIQFESICMQGSLFLQKYFTNGFIFKNYSVRVRCIRDGEQPTRCGAPSWLI